MGLLPHHFSNKCISPFLIPELNYDKLRGREGGGGGGGGGNGGGGESG